MYRSLKNNLVSDLPDVALQTLPKTFATLDWVGMDNIELPLKYSEDGVTHSVQSRIGAFVNLIDRGSRGIHMSRLYLHLDQLKIMVPEVVTTTLEKLLQSHSGVSSAAKLAIEFELMVRRNALVSDNSGWRFYPARIGAELIDGEVYFELEVKVIYSSTCPCSKSLATHLIQDKFSADFVGKETVQTAEIRAWLVENGLFATPHSQRSQATVKVYTPAKSLDKSKFPLLALTELIEKALQTPVQTMVKREDEQQFALLNGQNPMFCEDAARTVKNSLKSIYQRFHIKVEHFESLHSHDAVAYASND